MLGSNEQLSPNPSDLNSVTTVVDSFDTVTIVDTVDVRNGLYRIMFKGTVGYIILNRQVVSVSAALGENTCLPVDDPILAPSHLHVTYGPSSTSGVQVIKESQIYRVDTVTSPTSFEASLSYSLEEVQNITLPSSIYSRDRWVIELRMSGYKDPAVPFDAYTNQVVLCIQVK